MIENKETIPNAIDNYYSDNRVSQSILKYFLNMDKFSKFIEKFTNNSIFYEDELYYSDKEHFLIGNGVDILVTQNDEVYNDQFYVMTTGLPGEKIISMCHYIYDRITKESVEVLPDLSNYVELIKEAAKYEKYYPNYKIETILNKIISEGSAYFSQLIAANGKTLIDEKIDGKIKSIAKNVKIKLNEIITKYLNYIDTENIIILSQFPLFTDRTKGLADFIIIDDVNKRINIIDLKTTSTPLHLFNNEIKKYRLDIQLSFYKELILEGALSSLLTEDVLNYQIDCHLFVNSVVNIYNYKFITFNNDLLHIAKNGQKETYCASFYLDSDKQLFLNNQSSYDILIKKNKVVGFKHLHFLYENFKSCLEGNMTIEEIYENYLINNRDKISNINIEDIF